MLGGYGILLIIGWVVKKGGFNCVKNIYYVILAVVGLMLTVGLEIYSYFHGITYNVWYDSITLLLTSFAIFNLFLKAKITYRLNIVKWLSHELFVDILAKYVVINTCQEIKVLVIWLLAIVLSYGVIFVASSKLSDRALRFLFYTKIDRVNEKIHI